MPIFHLLVSPTHTSSGLQFLCQLDALPPLRGNLLSTIAGAGDGAGTTSSPSQPSHPGFLQCRVTPGALHPPPPQHRARGCGRMEAPGPQPGLARAAPGKPLGSSGDRDSSRVSPPSLFCAHGEECGLGHHGGGGLKPGLQAGQETASPPRGGLHRDRGSWLGKTQPVTPPPQLCLPLLRPQVAPQGSRSAFALARPWGPPGRLGRASRTCTCLHGKGPLDPSRAQTHLATG